MEGFSIYNSTDYKIFISIFTMDAAKLESAWLAPLSQFTPLSRAHPNHQPGVYRIQSEIIASEDQVILSISVNINLPSPPIKIETDDKGNFWWKIDPQR